MNGFQIVQSDVLTAVFPLLCVELRCGVIRAGVRRPAL